MLQYIRQDKNHQMKNKSCAEHIHHYHRFLCISALLEILAVNFLLSDIVKKSLIMFSHIIACTHFIQLDHMISLQLFQRPYVAFFWASEQEELAESCLFLRPMGGHMNTTDSSILSISFTAHCLFRYIVNRFRSKCSTVAHEQVLLSTIL